MTRTDELFSMTGRTLIQLADKLGVKVACNKTHTQLKEKKDNVVERILEVEKQISDKEAEKQIEEAVEVKAVEEATASDGTEYTQVMKEIQQDAAKAVEAVKKVKADKSKKSSVKSQATKKADGAKIDTPNIENVQKAQIDVETVFVECNYSIKKSTKKGVFSVVDANKHTVARVRVGNKKCVVYIPIRILSDDMNPDSIKDTYVAFNIQYGNLKRLSEIISGLKPFTRKTKKEDK